MFSILFAQDATTQHFCKLKSLGYVFPVERMNGIPDVYSIKDQCDLAISPAQAGICCCSTLPLPPVGSGKQVSGIVISSSPSQNRPFLRAWPRCYSTVQITQAPQISVVNREVKPSLSFSTPLGMFNPYS